ncbi:fimbria/pilus outer membrane usher protein [Pantoea sp. SGAir0184]
MPQHNKNKPHILRPSLLALALMQALGSISAQGAEPVEFDLASLQARGVDPRLAVHFKDAPRFMAGDNPVNLRVNGSERGRIRVHFDEQGEPCIDRAFLQQAKLVVPKSLPDGERISLNSLWPQAELHTDPGEERLTLIVPQQALAAADDSGDWQHGGVAGLFNYDAQYMDSAGRFAGVSYMQLDSEAGMNFSDWIVRSRQTLTRFNGENLLRHQAAYAQRTLAASQKVLQAGQINLVNSLFGSGQVLGIQLFPELSLEKQGGAGLVEGIASSASVVEVRQSGALVFSTTVPAGPFRLEGFSLLNTRSDLQVTVTGSQGEKREFVVPAASLPLSAASANGLSVGIGKLEQNGSAEAPWLATASRGWRLSPRNTLTAGVMGSNPWRAVAASVTSQPLDSTITRLQTTLADDAQHGNRGVALDASLSQQLSERVSLSFNASRQTSGYRELSDSLQRNQQDNRGRARDQLGAGIGWALDDFGSLSLSWARSRTFDGDSINYLNAGWTKSFDRAYLSINASRDNGGRYSTPDNRIYMTLNIPFGDAQTVSSYVNHSQRNGSRAGTRYSNRLSQDRSWSLSSERDFHSQRNSVTGAMDMVTPVSQLGGSLSNSNDGNTSWSMRASGGVAMHKHGVTLSPYRISDTFGIAKVGDESGVRIETPGGPTWTDGRGYAVIPSLNTFRRSDVQIDTRSLKKNVDIVNALQETSAARGSVSYIAFDVVRTRRVLVDVKDKAGKPLPYGASVFNPQNLFVTAVGADGAVFIPDAGDGGRMDVQVGGETLCSFDLILPPKPTEASLYETASAQCS